MKKEILFRGKRIDFDELIEGDLIHVDNKTLINIWSNLHLDSFIDDEFLEVESETVAQFTGFDDANGFKIFDNDKLTCNGVEYKIVIHKSGAYELYEKDDDETTCDSYFLFLQHQIMEIKI